jgi:transposase
MSPRTAWYGIHACAHDLCVRDILDSRKPIKGAIDIKKSINWETQNIPGTTLPYTDANAQAFSYIRPMITAAGGLSLSQVCTITGLEGSTIQNWVKRGWVGGSLKSKKYDERQVAIILIFNALRGCLQLDYIAKLLKSVGGVVEEGDLFSYMCEAVRTVGLNLDGAEQVIGHMLDGYTSGGDGKERLGKALTVMLYACVCTELSQTANLRLMQLV